jgi:RsiW-degrading membrane proteinase PrsW (M82 family)
MATGEHSAFFWRAWLVAGPAALVFSAVILWLDRHEREPWRLLLIAFLWGALGARAIYWPMRELLDNLRHANVEGKVRRFTGQYIQKHHVDLPDDIVWGVVEETLHAVGAGQLPNEQVEARVNQFVNKYIEEHQVRVPSSLVWGVVNETLKASDASTLGPILEEIGKAVVLFLLFLLLPQEFDGLLDGLIYGALIGLGFAMVENVHYLYRHQVEPPGNLTAAQAFWSTVRGRIFFHGLTGHAMYTGLAGAGLGLARTARREWLRWCAPPLGFALAVAAHIMWNAMDVEVWWQDLAIAGNPLVAAGLSHLTRLTKISGPLVIVFVGVLVLSWRREQKALREFLPSEGLTPYTTAEIMVRRMQRWRALWQALQDRGLTGLRAAACLQKVLIEWTFVRWHWAEGHLAKNAHAMQLEQRHRAQAIALARDLED